MQKKGISLTDFFFRVFPATAGGFLGAGLFLLVFFLLQIPASSDAANISFSTFAIVAVSFVGAISANVFAVLFMTLANPEKFPKRKLLLSNTFFSTLLLFLISIPFLLFSETSIGVTSTLFIFSATISAIFADLFKDRFSIGGVYGAFVAGFFLMIAFSKILEVSDTMSLAILLFALPITWFFVECFAAIGEMVMVLIKGKDQIN